MLGPALSLVIGDEGRDIAASAGHAAYEGTNKGGAQQGHENPLDIRQGGQQAVDDHVLLAALVVIIFFNATQNLSKGKDANQNRNKGHAAQQISGIQGKANGAGHGINAHRSQEKADESAHDALHHAAAGHAGNNAQAENGQGKIFRLGKLQCYLSQLGSQQNQADGTENAAEGTGQRGQPQSATRLTQLGSHGITVQGCGHRSRSTGSF